MQTLTFGYAGKWSPSYGAVQQAAHLVKLGPTPVGVEVAPAPPGYAPLYRVSTNNDYWQAAQTGRLAWTAIA